MGDEHAPGERDGRGDRVEAWLWCGATLLAVGIAASPRRSRRLSHPCVPVVRADSMKVWLQREGSPKSRITGTTFTNEGEFADDLFPVFEIRT